MSKVVRTGQGVAEGVGLAVDIARIGDVEHLHIRLVHLSTPHTAGQVSGPARLQKHDEQAHEKLKLTCRYKMRHSEGLLLSALGCHQ
jgi:hypothetical protein